MTVTDATPPEPPPVGPPAAAPSPTTPVMAIPHGSPPRGLDNVPASYSAQGRFGRMFRNLPVASPSPDSLHQLALKIVQAPEADKPDGTTDPDENPAIPAGYTYLGQFIDHDITFDPVSSLVRQNDPDALTDFRTPRLDLDNIYGRGPADQPYLYDQGDPDKAKLLLGSTASDEPAFAGPDLQRNAQGRALIGDPRNDENLIVSQLQTVFLRFHNATVDHLRTTGMAGEGLLKEAQRLVRWHYQWVVVHDFLAGHIVGQEVIDDILRPEPYAVGGDNPPPTQVMRPQLRFFHPQENAFIPVEFSVAAYRFGHSMVRPSYFINERVKSAHQNARLAIFSANTQANELENLNGFRNLPREWGFQWRFFYELDPAKPAQRSYKIDDQLVDPLGHLPSTETSQDVPSLAERNLLRGLRLGLPSGQHVARAMGIPPLDDAALGLDGELAENAPLWYYVLKEAAILGASTKLGPVGGRIVAEVLLGLLAADPLSYLSVEPNWKPEAPFVAEGVDFDMPALIRFAQAEIEPAPASQPPVGWTG